MTKEEKMREANPGLKDAWEKYQMLLKLYDNGSYKDDPLPWQYNIAIGRSSRTIYDT